MNLFNVFQGFEFYLKHMFSKIILKMESNLNQDKCAFTLLLAKSTEIFDWKLSHHVSMQQQQQEKKNPYSALHRITSSPTIQGPCKMQKKLKAVITFIDS